jgi:hypothetical protein
LPGNRFGLKLNEIRPTMAHDSSEKMRIPQPAHPDRRQQPLPSHRPKSPDEDPDAPSRVRAILASPSYRLAEQDLAFLGRDEARGVRLQIEYLKPETLLQEHAIRDTIVVYGSTRIPEPTAARRGVEALRQALETDPRNNSLIRKLAVAERILAKSRFYEIAREFGRLVGSSCDNDGARSKMVITTGGGPGIMKPPTVEPSMSGQNPLVSISICHTSNIPIPTLHRTCVCDSTTLPCARCICSCARRRWSLSQAALGRWTSCSRS